MEEPLGSPEEILDGWLVTGMWYLVVSLLTFWAPPREWPDVSSTPHTLEKALHVVGETLSWLSAHVAECFFQLCELRQRPHFTMQ